MIKIKVSIIIPVYNAEKYINKLLNSIYSQKYEYLEVIIIDDGSTDNSKDIIESWITKDSRIKYYYQKNSGVSSARNLGITKSNGDYLVFVDSDDYLLENYILDFITNIENDDTLLIQDINRYMSNKIIRNYLNLKPNCYRLLNNKFDSKLFSGYPFNKFFKRNIILTNNIIFDEELLIREDEAFFFNYLKYVKFIKTINKANYNYISTGNNLSEKKFTYIEYSKVLSNFNNFINSKIILEQRNNDDLTINYTIIFNQFLNYLTKLNSVERNNILKENHSNIKFSLVKQNIIRFRLFTIFYNFKLYRLFNFLWYNNI